MSDIYTEIKNERIQQDKKWGQQNHSPHYWMTILMEEVGEAAHAICGRTHDYRNYREELIQVAAVSVAAIENLDRQAQKKSPAPEGRESDEHCI